MPGAKKIIVGALALLALIAGLAAAFAFAAPGPTAAPPGRVALVSRATITTTVTPSGVVQAAAQLSLSFPVLGVVDRVLVTAGQRVAKGQLLATLTDPTLHAALGDDQGALRVAEANMARVQAPPSPEAVRAARAALDAAEARLAALRAGAQPSALTAQLRLSADQTRLALLEMASAVPAVPVLPACAASNAQVGASPNERRAQAAVDADQQALTRAALLQRALDLSQAEAAVAGAIDPLHTTMHPSTPWDVGYARAQRAQARQVVAEDYYLLATQTRLRAPSAGMVLAVHALAGQLSSASGGTAATSAGDGASVIMAADSRLRVVANVDEADIGSVTVGAPVTATFDAYPDRVYRGVVTGLPYLATTTSNVTTYPVDVALDGSSHGLTAGMTANLTVVTARLRGAIVVPTAAISSSSLGDVVTVLDDGNRRVRTPVRLGASDMSDTQVRAGLRPGQRVLIPDGPSPGGQGTGLP